ncbi:MAG: ornithine cyclodeaminase family protein, partial [Gemmatimonadota bacterium]
MDASRKMDSAAGQTLLLTRADVAELFTLEEYTDAVEAAFKAYAEGQALAPGLLHVDATGGEFHIKAGGLAVGGHTYFGLKANGSFFGNPAHGLPAIRGIVYVADGTTGAPLAVMDSIHLTIQRTGA